jgi:hypothetical protein
LLQLLEHCAASAEAAAAVALSSNALASLPSAFCVRAATITLCWLVLQVSPHTSTPRLLSPSRLPGTLCNLALQADTGMAIFSAGCCPVLAKLCVSTHEHVQREALGFLGNMAALSCVDSARLGAISIENVCHVIKRSESPRVLLLALGTLNNLTKSCDANRQLCVAEVVVASLVKLLKSSPGKDVLLQLITLLWNLSLTPSAAKALIASGAHHALSQTTFTGIEIKRAAAGVCARRVACNLLILAQLQLCSWSCGSTGVGWNLTAQRRNK